MVEHHWVGPGTYIRFHRESTSVVSIRGEEMRATLANPTLGNWSAETGTSTLAFFYGGACVLKRWKHCSLSPVKHATDISNKKAALCHFQEHWHFSDPGCVMFSSITTFISQRREICLWDGKNQLTPPLYKNPWELITQGFTSSLLGVTDEGPQISMILFSQVRLDRTVGPFSRWYPSNGFFLCSDFSLLK